ncbi:phage tail protein [Lysinibacillus fusiformis]|uniref:phage tail protein n=1 Tax=Lysinibacillus fusiformis TaxID=28031 RepID=UPI003D04C274
MAKIGSFADVVFEVSTKRVLTFDDFERTNSPRWQEHTILGQKPILEFEGPAADTISFTILLKAELGINPGKQLSRLRNFSHSGRKGLFIRGNVPISTNYFVITNIHEKHRNIDKQGNVLSIEVDLDIKEYPKQPPSVSTKKTVSSNQKNNKAATSKKGTGTMTITVKSVHIRGGPGVNNKVIGYAMKGDKLTVYGEKNGWYSLGGGKYISANDAYSTFKKG